MMPERLAKTDPFKAVTEMIGSGPFRFAKDEFNPGNSVVYTKNADYVPRQEAPDWTSGGKVVHFDRVEWKIIPDAATASAALQAGEIDWWDQVQADLVPLIRADQSIEMAPSNPQGYIAAMRFNCIQPPFNDARLRRAIQVAVNQDDYMRAVTGNDPSLFQICRSQFPCGTTYGTQIGGAAMSGNLVEAMKMIKEAGYSGQKAVVINPTDFATIAPLGDITFDTLKKLGINAEMVAADWGTVVQRRSSKEPVEKGGWSVFHTWFTGGFIINPVVSAPFRGQGAAGWFGWNDDPKVEQLTDEWLQAKDLEARKKIAEAIQQENFAQAPTINLGQFQIPTAYRKTVQGHVACSSPLFWNVKRV
jgi:peptide/nickel transport system substrate-binding protein